MFNSTDCNYKIIHYLFIGWNHGSLPFSNMVIDGAKRRNFVSKTVDFLLRNKFDGLGITFDIKKIIRAYCKTSFL